MFYETEKENHGFVIDPLKALFVRPIGWISSLSAQGVANLAPYSFFNLISENPGRIMFASTGYKHSVQNIQETEEFVVNIATEELAKAMNITSAPVEEEVDEFELAHLEKAPSHLVKTPRVAASPAHLECKLEKILELPAPQGAATYLVVGRILGVHVQDEFISDGRINTAAMRMILRAGYADYATIQDLWQMKRG